MAELKIYGLKTCDACRKAAKATGAELVDVRQDPLDERTLGIFLSVFGEALVNRRSTTWRGLSEEERAQDALALLKAHPALMKRPVIADGNQLRAGWDKDVKAELGIG